MGRGEGLIWIVYDSPLSQVIYQDLPAPSCFIFSRYMQPSLHSWVWIPFTPEFFSQAFRSVHTCLSRVHTMLLHEKSNWRALGILPGITGTLAFFFFHTTIVLGKQLAYRAKYKKLNKQASSNANRVTKLRAVLPSNLTMTCDSSIWHVTRKESQEKNWKWNSCQVNA